MLTRLGRRFVDASDSERKKSPVEGRSSNHFEFAFTESEFLLDFGQSYDKAEGLNTPESS